MININLINTDQHWFYTKDPESQPDKGYGRGYGTAAGSELGQRISYGLGDGSL